MPTNLLRCALLCACLAMACKKEYSKEDWDVPTPVEVTPPVAEVPETCGYSPYTIGSKFDFEFKSGANGSITPYSVSVRKDTTINGEHFSILSSGSTEQYLTCKDGKYYLYEPAVNLPSYKTVAGNRVFLYDYKSVGNTWADTIQITNAGLKQTGLIVYTILQQGISKKVLDTTYNDVIGVKQESALLIEGKTYIMRTIGTYYYAKGVGYIEADYDADTTRLKSYSIAGSN